MQVRKTRKTGFCVSGALIKTGVCETFMDIKELTDLLVKSGETVHCKYVPWWEDDFENCTYRYDILKEEEIKEIESCACSAERSLLFEPVSSVGLNLFALFVWHNLYNLVETLLSEGADANCTDGKGKKITPLMLVCCRSNLKMAELLLAHGANTKACDAAGKNCYHYLAYPYIEGMTRMYAGMRYTIGQRTAIARLLGEGINQKDNTGMTPFAYMLHSNCTNCSYALTDIFLEKGAETDYLDEKGNTLLMTAILERHMTAAFRLAENSSLINRENAEGKTPLAAAMNFRNEALCMVLKEHGAQGDCDFIRMDMGNLSRITSNAFAFPSEDSDKLTPALYLAGRLLHQIDTDDDDELGFFLGILHNALNNDEGCKVLDLCKEAGVDFLAPIHKGGGVDCLRDACIRGYYGVRIIEKLISLGVDINKAVVQGRTPANIVASLQKRTMLFGGKKDDYYEKAAEYFSKESMEQVDNNGTTALHWAARNNHARMLEVMAGKGADVNLTEDEPAESGNTPLHTACIYGSAEAAAVLIASGADDTLRNKNGETPAHMAVMKKRFGGELESKQREKLLKELKHLDIPRNDGSTPLMLLQYLNLNATRELQPIFLEKGADVNHTDNRGNTALILNTDNQCYKDVIKELVRAGADVNIADNNGNTALYYALRYGNQETARFLIKKGADYNHSNNQGITPMQVAVEKGYDTVLELMM